MNPKLFNKQLLVFFSILMIINVNTATTLVNETNDLKHRLKDRIEAPESIQRYRYNETENIQINESKQSKDYNQFIDQKRDKDKIKDQSIKDLLIELKEQYKYKDNDKVKNQSIKELPEEQHNETENHTNNNKQTDKMIISDNNKQKDNNITPDTIDKLLQNKSNNTETQKNNTETNKEEKEEVLEPKEECIGQPEYCNMTREDYTTMLLNYMHPQTYEWVLIFTHSLVFTMGLIGNALVCIAVYRNHTMRTVTNYFIVNLAVADFMVILICLPPTVLWDVTETWFLGDVMCKVLLYFQSVSVTVSVLTLTFISVDRWYAICFPLRFKSTTGRAKTAILVIWLLSLLFNSPELVVLTTVQTVPLRFNLQYLVQCMATWSPRSDLVWHVIKTLFIYTIPLLLMTVAYHQIVRVLWRANKIPGRAETFKLASAEETQLRSRRKAAKMLVAVVVMFAVCYFPVHLLSVLRYTLDMEQSDVITCLALLSHVMCYANSAINPLIYNFMSGKFRREFRRSFCCAKSPTSDNFSTLSRMTTTRRKPSELVTFHYRHQGQGHYSTTTFIENGYHRNGCLT